MLRSLNYVSCCGKSLTSNLSTTRLTSIRPPSWLNLMVTEVRKSKANIRKHESLHRTRLSYFNEAETPSLHVLTYLNLKEMQQESLSTARENSLGSAEKKNLRNECGGQNQTRAMYPLFLKICFLRSFAVSTLL